MLLPRSSRSTRRKNANRFGSRTCVKKTTWRVIARIGNAEYRRVTFLKVSEAGQTELILPRS
ncbi:hypothetical protein PISMIDRAFT_189804 [Pisolithus microcarpus 441]|uniref:Uncharacterized protein n=1 Tax=Pisolithus microcarpus 441 TaxID=765257 RepID=A0A0C9Z7Z5_9AGAM|nr:hypothetical protein PISMIDRAFT_189804 [Pisolithus microcarpus 441]